MIFKMGHCIRCGNCCKYIVHTASKERFDDYGTREYYKYKGATFIEFGNYWTDAVLLKSECKFLSTTEKGCGCKFHGTDKEPRMCRDFPASPHPFHDVMIKMGCGFRFEEIDVESPQPIG